MIGTSLPRTFVRNCFITLSQKCKGAFIPVTFSIIKQPGVSRAMFISFGIIWLFTATITPLKRRQEQPFYRRPCQMILVQHSQGYWLSILNPCWLCFLSESITSIYYFYNETDICLSYAAEAKARELIPTETVRHLPQGSAGVEPTVPVEKAAMASLYEDRIWDIIID